MTYVPAPDRYDQIPYRRCGRSGIRLPAISLGLWQNFGSDRPLDVQRAIILRAFDLGVTHFDLANNYGGHTLNTSDDPVGRLETGSPYGSAERNFGRILRGYLLASLDQSLARMGLDYVDIFYSHRADPETPLEETMGALATAVTSGRALYAGSSSYSPGRTEQAATMLRDLSTPLLIHQPSYSILNRWIEDGLLDTLEREGAGCIAFSPLAQGLLTGKYSGGVPAGSRAARGGSSLSADQLSEQNLARVRALNDVARARGQSLAQMALAWALRDQRVTSVLIGASSVAQLEENVAAGGQTDFSAEELAAIDRHSAESGINIWAASSAE